MIKFVGNIDHQRCDEPKNTSCPLCVLCVFVVATAANYRRRNRLRAEGVTAQPPRAVQRSSAGRALPTS